MNSFVLSAVSFSSSIVFPHCDKPLEFEILAYSYNFPIDLNAHRTQILSRWVRLEEYRAIRIIKLLTQKQSIYSKVPKASRIRNTGTVSCISESSKNFGAALEINP